MKQKIKTWLIHWLGGVTEEEKLKGYVKICDKESCQDKHLQCIIKKEIYEAGFNDGQNEAEKHIFYNGKDHAFAEIKEYAESLDGLDADTWCKRVWGFIDDRV